MVIKMEADKIGNTGDNPWAFLNLVGRYLRDQEIVLQVVEHYIMDLDFHLVQEMSSIRVLDGALGIQFPPTPNLQ